MRPGDFALWRAVAYGRVRSAIPHTLVGADGEHVALYCRPGTLGKRPRRAFVEDPDQLRTGDWQIGDFTWQTHHVLRTTPLGRAHSIDLFWTEAWEFRGWYVNLQEPLRRSRFGFDTRDEALDITVAPDGTWAWKDEDHLEQLVQYGVIRGDRAAQIRGEGERVLAEWPFPTGWEEWRPDPGWHLPQLPAGWERL